MTLNLWKVRYQKKWCMTVRQMHIRRIVRWSKKKNYLHWNQITSKHNYEKYVIVRHRIKPQEKKWKRQKCLDLIGKKQWEALLLEMYIVDTFISSAAMTFIETAYKTTKQWYRLRWLLFSCVLKMPGLIQGIYGFEYFFSAQQMNDDASYGSSSLYTIQVKSCTFYQFRCILFWPFDKFHRYYCATQLLFVCTAHLIDWCSLFKKCIKSN